MRYLLTLCSLLLAQPVMAGKAIMEQIAATGNTIFVDTQTARVGVSTTGYGGGVSNVSLFTSSNVVVSSPTSSNNIVLYATGTVSAARFEGSGAGIVDLSVPGSSVDFSTITTALATKANKGNTSHVDLSTVTNRFNQVAVDTTTLDADLTTEVSDRLSGDFYVGLATYNIRTDLTAETVARVGQDTAIGASTKVLNNLLDSETLARIAADFNLGASTKATNIDLAAISLSTAVLSVSTVTLNNNKVNRIGNDTMGGSLTLPDLVATYGVDAGTVVADSSRIGSMVGTTLLVHNTLTSTGTARFGVHVEPVGGFDQTSYSVFNASGSLSMARSESISLSSNGYISGQSSATFNAFFGDGSHLTGITAPSDPNKVDKNTPEQVNLSTVTVALAGKQGADADLDDLADGSLTGSKVGSGVPAANIASGSLGATVIASSVAAIVAANSCGSATVSCHINFGADGRIQSVSSTTIAGGGDAILSATQTWSGGNSLYGSTTFYGRLSLVDTSSATFIPSGSEAGQATNIVCKATVSFEASGLRDFEISHIGTGQNNNGAGNNFVVFYLIDGGYVNEMSGTKSAIVVTAATSGGYNLSFSDTIDKSLLTPGTHTACIGYASNSSTTIVWPSSYGAITGHRSRFRVSPILGR